MVQGSEHPRPAADWLLPPGDQQGLRRYVATLRERFWLIVAITVITTAAAAVYVATATKAYEAEATLLISPIDSADSNLMGLGLIEASSDPTRDTQTAAELIATTEVASRVKGSLGDSRTPTALLSTVMIEPVAQTNIVSVTASADSPGGAANVANAFAAQAVASRTDQLHQQVEGRLQSLGNQSAGGADAQQIRTLQQLNQNPDPTVRVATRATPPVAATSPRPLLSLAAGLLTGLVLGVAAAFAFQVLDPRLRREEQLRQLYRIPVLGRIPRESRASKENPLGPRKISPAAAEAYRTLRGTVSASGGRGGSQVLLVTGSSPSEGKTTTAINLAASLASTGRRVILIEADLRRPAISRALGVDAQRGVVSVLIESVAMEDALIDGDELGLPNLQLLLAENEGEWISELFSLPTAVDLLDHARRLADYVIIDSPPLTDVIDALPLARNVDNVLVVVRPGTTRIAKLARLGELFAENGIRPMGFAVIGTPRPGRSDSTYYFDRRESVNQKAPEPLGAEEPISHP